METVYSEALEIEVLATSFWVGKLVFFSIQFIFGSNLYIVGSIP